MKENKAIFWFWTIQTVYYIVTSHYYYKLIIVQGLNSGLP